MQAIDILELVIPEARKRGMQVYPEVMEPLFNYAGHGSAQHGRHPQPAAGAGGRPTSAASAPSRASTTPTTARWWHSIIEDYCRSYDIDGVMWCNERRSPLDNLIAGRRP